MTATQVPEWTLGDRLRKAREKAGLKQDEMAEIFGVSPATISNWENGQRMPRTGELALAKEWAFQTSVPFDWLIGVRIGCLPPGVSDLNRALDRIPTPKSGMTAVEALTRAAQRVSGHGDFVSTGRTIDSLAVA